MTNLLHRQEYNIYSEHMITARQKNTLEIIKITRVKILFENIFVILCSLSMHTASYGRFNMSVDCRKSSVNGAYVDTFTATCDVSF